MYKITSTNEKIDLTHSIFDVVASSKEEEKVAKEKKAEYLLKIGQIVKSN